MQYVILQGLNKLFILQYFPEAEQLVSLHLKKSLLTLDTVLVYL